MTLRSSDLQSDSDLDNIRNSCDVWYRKWIEREEIKRKWGNVESESLSISSFSLYFFTLSSFSHGPAARLQKVVQPWCWWWWQWQYWWANQFRIVIVHLFRRKYLFPSSPNKEVFFNCLSAIMHKSVWRSESFESSILIGHGFCRSSALSVGQLCWLVSHRIVVTHCLV